jgi:23S rRNA-/tRNA-specific pseudouridylate synthase
LAPDTTLPENARIRHFLHRHEPPVARTDVGIVGLTPDLVAVSKPAGMPVHVAGQYRKNTVLGVLLGARPELAPLLPAHRLDRPVSGVLLFARNPAAAERLRQLIEGHEVQKVYVARVQGAFPAAGPDGQPTVVADAALAWDAATNMACVVPKEEAEAAVAAAPDPAKAAAPAAEGAATTAPAAADAQPPAPGAEATAEGEEEEGTSRRKKRQRLRAGKEERRAAFQAAARAAAARGGRTPGRPALTTFRLLQVAPDGLTSLVECRPMTGRSHQIRVHLASLGHPVANDGQYGGRYDGPLPARILAKQLGVSWVEARETGKPTDDARDAQEAARSEGAAAAAGGAAPEADPASMFRTGERFQVPEHLRDPHCPHCPYYAPCDYPVDLRPLWLHARTYSCAEWSFTAEPPAWAAPEWVPPPEPAAA